MTREARRSVACRQLTGARAGGAGEEGRCLTWAGAVGGRAVESEVLVFSTRCFLCAAFPCTDGVQGDSNKA